MSQIFNYIDYNDILHIDTYNEPQLIHNFENVKFRTDVSSYLKFVTPIGVYSNKIISITNMQLSFLVQKYFHFLGDQYAQDLRNTYNQIILAGSENIITIDEAVFQFFDYDCINGTGHSYDCMFHLLYNFKKNNMLTKLLVVDTDNKYYNSTLRIIKKYFQVDYIFIKPNITYLFKRFYCTRSYQNIFFTDVKHFINTNLILPIIEQYEKINETYYDDVIKIKHKNVDCLDRLSSSFEKTKLLEIFLSDKNIFDLNKIDDNEELKIFLLNKAKKIRVAWGSIYFIYINYYLHDTNNKVISVIFHKNILPECDQIANENKICSQNVNYIRHLQIKNNVYDNWKFEGEIISNITSIDEYILQTKI